MIVVCARETQRSAIISARSRNLSLYRRYQRTQSTMISWSKCRPLKSPSIFVCARQLCRSTDLPTTMLCPSGSHQSPGGDRAANSALHIIAIGRLRTDQRTKHYVARRIAEGHSKLDAIRALNRYLAREVFTLIMQRQKEINATRIAA